MLSSLLAGIFLLSQQPTPEQVDGYVRSQAISGRSLPVTPVIDVLPKRDEALLALYRHAFSEAVVGFSCVPAAYPGGPIAPAYVRLRQALKERRLRVRSVLAERVGIANLDRVEREIEKEAALMEAEVHISCIPRDTERARRRYARLLSTLERRLASSPRR